ncbi:hypothetical protein [Sphingomonas faeni]|uniref:hypothetical protein n=1 Tax=Sphingomonas faeni TaxID=185950 RepID=UPI00335429EA
MVDRPIIFSAAMVRALLAGRKTQTRRLATSPLRRVEVGDRLYVRESMHLWSAGHDAEVTFAADDRSFQTGPNTGDIPDASLTAYFRMVDQSRAKGRRISRPSIHMPRWASRLTLIVEGVKVEPLQSITSRDAISEGIERAGGEWRCYDSSGTGCLGARESFCTLWSSLHEAPGQRWQDNPNVVALSFRVEHGNIDTLYPNLRSARA